MCGIIVQIFFCVVVAEWAKASWEWGKKNGICDGTRPQTTITREEVVAMLNKYENSRK
jgi:hypothetical protein